MLKIYSSEHLVSILSHRHQSMKRNSLNAELAKFPEIAGAEFRSKKFILK